MSKRCLVTYEALSVFPQKGSSSVSPDNNLVSLAGVQSITGLAATARVLAARGCAAPLSHDFEVMKYLQQDDTLLRTIDGFFQGTEKNHQQTFEYEGKDESIFNICLKMLKPKTSNTLCMLAYGAELRLGLTEPCPGVYRAANYMHPFQLIQISQIKLNDLKMNYLAQQHPGETVRFFAAKDLENAGLAKPKAIERKIVPILVTSCEIDGDQTLKHDQEPLRFAKLRLPEGDFEITVLFNLTKAEEKTVMKPSIKTEKIKQERKKKNTDAFATARDDCPGIFTTNLDDYQKYLATKSSDCSVAHSNIRYFPLNHQQKQAKLSTNVKNFNQPITQTILELQKYKYCDIIENTQINRITKLFLTSFIPNVVQTFQEYSLDVNAKVPSIEVIPNYPIIISLVQGYYALSFQYSSIFRGVTQWAQLHEFDINDFISSLSCLARGINQQIFSRLQLNCQDSYITNSNGHSTPTFYQAWSCNQLFGQSILQQLGHDLIIDFDIPQSLLELDDVDPQKPPTQLLPLLQYCTTFAQAHIVNEEESIDKQKIVYAAKRNLELLQKKQTIEQLVYETVEARKDAGDDLLGIYMHPPTYRELVPQQTEVFSRDLDCIQLKFDNNKQYIDVTTAIWDDLNSQTESISIQTMNDILKLSQSCQTSPLRVLPTPANEMLPSPTGCPDMFLVTDIDQVVERMDQFGYNAGPLRSKAMPEAEELEPEVTAADTISFYHPSLLEPQNNLRVAYVLHGFSVLIPKFFEKKFRCLSDFADQYQRQGLLELGFDAQALAMAADLEVYQNGFGPGLVFAERLNRFYYFPIFSWLKQSFQARFGADVFAQAVQLQDHLIHNKPVGEEATSSVLSLLDANVISKKFQQQLADFQAAGYTTQNLMGHVAAYVLQQHQFNDLVALLLDKEEPHNVLLNDSFVAAEQQQMTVYARQIYQQIDDTSVFDFVLDNVDSLMDLYCESTANISDKMLDHLVGENVFDNINQRRQFIIGARESFCSDLETLTECAQLGAPTTLISFSELATSHPFVKNSYVAADDEPLMPINRIVSGKLRGIALAKALITGQISPDDDAAACTKQFGFASTAATMRCYKALVHAADHQGNVMTSYNTVRNASQLGNDHIIIPQNLIQIKDQFAQLHDITHIVAPLFKTYGPAEHCGQEPLIDIFGRELRSKSPYSVKFVNRTENVPSPLDKEAPPLPATGGEDQSNQQQIEFWESVKNKMFKIPNERITALQAPLYCLEERELVYYLPTSNIGDVQCGCRDVSAVLHSNPGGLNLEQHQRGIYYLSPYYQPPKSLIEVGRLSVFKSLSSLVIRNLQLIIRQQLNAIVGLPNTIQDREGKLGEFIAIYFLKRWKGNADHIKADINEKSWRLRGIIGEDAKIQPPDEFLKEIQKFSGERRIDRFQNYIDDCLRNCLDFDGLVHDITQKYPILNLFHYGDPDSDTPTPSEIVQFLQINSVNDQSLLSQKQALQQYRSPTLLNEELNIAQNHLKDLESENYIHNLDIAEDLRKFRQIDAQYEVNEMFNTFVTTQYAKVCVEARILGQKVPPDQLLTGGYETSALRVNNLILEGIDSMAQQYNVECDNMWEKENFSWNDIIE